MKSVATSVRITASSRALLSLLAEKTGRPKAQIVEEALRAWEDRVFWADVQQSFASVAESAELRAERDLWETTVADGLQSKPARRKRSR